MQIDTVNKIISFQGKIFPSYFNGFTSWTKNHHFIVFKEGRAAHNALVRSEVSDLDILNTLEMLGAKPGNNLSIDAWNARGDNSNPEPEKKVTGTEIEVVLSWQNQKNIEVNQIFIDRFQKGFLFRFGGHRELMTVWKSGCVVCLESCPGARISNANYTLRDYEKGLATFDLKKSNLPKDGTEVTIHLKIKNL